MSTVNPLFSIVVPMLLALPVHLSAQVIKPESQEGIFTTTSEVSGPSPLFELPADIPTEAGAATCHAHIPGISNGTVPVYLINRTAAKTSLRLLGSDTDLKARRKLDNGKWERIQPANGRFSCADSCNDLSIPPGMFVRVSVACPSSGTPATLRYQIADQWVSNEFQGFYLPEARDQAQRDLKSPADCPAWAGILKSPLSSSDFAYRWAPSHLEPDLSPEQRFARQAAAIDLLQQYADFQAARLACDDALANVGQLPKPVAEAASARFSLLRSRSAVAAATDLEFATRCLGYLRTTPADPTYGHPSQYPGLCWQALASLAENSSEASAVPWTQVFALWKDHLPTATLAELMGMAKFMENPCLANEHLPTQILISLLKSNVPTMRENAVKRLLERNQDKDLAEAAAGLDEAGKAIVIQFVAADREHFRRRHGPLCDFLIASAKADPEATFEAIDKSTIWNQAVYLEPGLSLAFGNFFVNIVSVGLDGPVKIEDNRMEDRVRRCMRYVNHTALLKKLAGSEAYFAKKGAPPESERRYFVAWEARRQSMRLGYAP